MNKKTITSTERFTNTVDYYTKYRPSYPQSIIELLEKRCDLTPEKIIADVGFGTGIFTELLLQHGNHVFGVEPNRAMREAGEKFLSKYSYFKSIDGTAEATTLLDHSVDLITVAQAFHWFDKVAVKTEFVRILRPGGFVVLIWNLHDQDVSPLMQAYEKLLNNFGANYRLAKSDNNEANEIKKFFYPHALSIAVFSHAHFLDWDSFLGRIISSSYMPKPGDPHYEPMVAAAKQMFDKFSLQGKIQLSYKAKCYYGVL